MRNMTQEELLEGIKLAKQAIEVAKACNQKGIYAVSRYQVQADKAYLSLADGDVEREAVGEHVHYHFEIQGVPFVVLLDKEEM